MERARLVARNSYPSPCCHPVQRQANQLHRGVNHHSQALWYVFRGMTLNVDTVSMQGKSSSNSSLQSGLARRPTGRKRGIATASSRSCAIVTASIPLLLGVTMVLLLTPGSGADLSKIDAQVCPLHCLKAMLTRLHRAISIRYLTSALTEQ